MLLRRWNWKTAIKVAKRDGEIECAEKIAIKMKDKGMDVEEIAEITELSVDDIMWTLKKRLRYENAKRMDS